MRTTPLYLSVLLLLSSSTNVGATVCSEVPDVVILLDRSGSMNEQVSGTSKATIAANAIDNLLTKFAGQISFGLALFPHWPHQKDCSTAKINITPGTTNKSAILSMLASAYPDGNTPIAASLDATGKFLEGYSTKPRYVILVTDGKETCLGPSEPLSIPGSCAWNSGTNYRQCGDCGWQFCLSSSSWAPTCEGNTDRFGCPYGQTCGSNGICSGPAGGSANAQLAAAALAAAGIKTYVIGFGGQVDATALSGIAGSGGTGSYFQANNQAQLDSALDQIAGDISCCGDGKVDADETCDSAIAAGQPGACPTSCSDANICTTDTMLGAGCKAECKHSPVTATSSGDGCCPPGGNPGNDSDCPAGCGNGYVDAGEKCDTGIPAGQPGACPASCDDGQKCTADVMVGGGCQTECTHSAITAPKSGDGCCPPGFNAGSDGDCPPSCGDGNFDLGELCDTGIPANQPGACPTSCDDGDACTIDSKSGTLCDTKCTYKQITSKSPGDGCCPPGANAGTDADCPAGCGNGYLDKGEVCDPGITAGIGACPQQCDDGNACTIDYVGGSACNAKCVHDPIPASLSHSDGCCPPNLSLDQDLDCPPPCDPDKNEDCIDPCANVSCPTGMHCEQAKCIADYPEGQPYDGGVPYGADGFGPNRMISVSSGGGCDCSVDAASQPWPLAASFALVLLLLGRARRRRR